LAEDVAETRAARSRPRPGGACASPAREDAPVEIEPRPGRAARRVTDVVIVCPELVVHFTLLRVRQHIVSLGELFKLLLGSFVTGIQIGVVFSRKTAIRLANLFLSRGALDSERFVIIFALSHKCIGSREWGIGSGE